MAATKIVAHQFSVSPKSIPAFHVSENLETWNYTAFPWACNRLRSA
jgi:hypothetical protein